MSTETPAEIRDEELLAATARGDLDAFHAFYRRHAGRVLAYARRLSGEPALAEDITQEVFTAVWLRAATFRPDRGNAVCWLYTLTRNKFVDHWRRSGGDIGTETLDEPRHSGSSTGGGDLRVSLRQALDRIAPEQRRAIEMAYFGGLTYEETADRLSLPVGTLKSRIRLGLRTMRLVLAPVAL